MKDDKETAYNKHPNVPVGKDAPAPTKKRDKNDAYHDDDSHGPLEEGNGVELKGLNDEENDDEETEEKGDK